MVQVATKQPVKIVLNTSIVMCLRNNRHLDYRDYIIKSFQTRLNHGQVYFLYCPIFTIGLKDDDNLDSIVFHVKAHGLRFKKRNGPDSIITRFAYKSMTTMVGLGGLCTSPKGETILFLSNLISKSNFIIHKKIMWNEVDFP